jgi:Leucine-rich repeat (LRR) protein
MIAIRRLFTFFFIILFVFSCKKSPTGSDSIVVTFPDANFEALVREVLDKPTGDILDTDLEAISEMIGNDLSIVDLTGVEYCINLVYLELSNNQIANIAPLVDNIGFDTGDFIDLQGNPLSDTSKNTHIPDLITRGVTVYYDEPEMVVTIPDADFEALVRDLLQKPTGDITNLELATITTMRHRNGNINDLTGIEYCKNLGTIDFYKNNITDITKIGQLKKLKELYLYRNAITNIEVINGLNGLINLSIGHNNIADISVLSTLPKLKYLSIGDNPINNIDTVRELISLEYISISSLNLTSLDILTDLINLESIEARYDQISDISALVNLSKLERIAMNGNNVSNISAIANLQSLDDVNFNDNNVTDISVFANLPNVTGIGLGGNQISDIISLSTGLDKFEYIVLRDNQISDIKALVDNVNVGDGDTVYLQNNPLSATSTGTYIPQLEARGVTVHQ